MNELIDKYLYVKNDAYYIANGKQFAHSVHGRSNFRYNKAKEQANLESVSVEIVIDKIESFLKVIGITTAENPIISNPMNIDYKEIQEKYSLNSQKDIVWLKFTRDGYVGVVAVSDDVNFQIPESQDDYNKKIKVYNSYKRKYEKEWEYNTSGIIVHQLGKQWDDTFVLVFPLKNIPIGYDRKNIEHAVGNMLIENKVPILDVYSHLY